MMTIWQAIFLGVLQGATEFLPISSSGHLVLVPWLFGWQKADLSFDTTVHLGTLVAVLIYFRRDIWQITVGVLRTLQRRSLSDPHGKLGWLILLGCLPAALIGLLFESFFERLFGTPAIAASLLLVTGLILLVSERLSQRDRPLMSITAKDSLLIGLAQAGAIAPGISRSGATIATGLILNIEREAAARYSFLLSLPIIFGAGVLKLKDAFEIGISAGDTMALVVGFIAAAVSGYACIYWLLAYIRRHSLYLFAGYCWIFGLSCLAVAVIRGG